MATNILTELAAGLHTRSATATRRAAARLAAQFPENAILTLSGELGAGKTTFVQGLAAAWHISHVTSPSYTLTNIHRGDRQLVHLDAYRLDHPAAVDDLLLDELLTPPWCLAIEWPEHIAPWLAERPHFALRLSDVGAGRRLLTGAWQQPG